MGLWSYRARASPPPREAGKDEANTYSSHFESGASQKASAFKKIFVPNKESSVS